MFSQNQNAVNCLLCGAELKYYDESREMKCHYCGKTFLSNADCAKGHFVCDKCHSAGAVEIIREFTIASSSINPLQMADDLMKHPKVKMHGPEHHFLVPAVMLAAYYNKNNDSDTKKIKIEEAEKRAKNVLGGFCGFYGNCGAGVGTGIFISLITGATPLSKDSWKLSNLMTSRALYEIAIHGGPRCCKRDTFLAISNAVSFLKENFSVNLEEVEDLRCSFSSMNRECLKAECRFFYS